ncbi:AGAP002756-PA [Anopheles gambiae str. PEST]|uniref:AGAP002756-PA n=1 Tax=Anopheles gambiae TaxID=7165 RepID=A0ND05_ANOGA|nr:AGAP002756-PA [Anopheles gambiae str. PEST]
MAKTKWNLIFATFIVSCVSLIVLIVSLCTPYWITSEAYESNASGNSEINYGLFSGSLIQNFLPNSRYYTLTLTCLYHEYVCAYSCQEDEESRTEEVLQLLKGLPPADCPSSSSRMLPLVHRIDPPIFPQNRQASANIDRSNFINTGLWVSTVVFIGIAISFAAISASFSIINVLFNPIEPVFSVFGLYIWNGVALGSTALCMIMWGALFASTLADNIAITDTLTTQIPYSSDGLASLGVCYWILLLSILLHGLNVGLLLWRKRIVNKEPPPTTIDVDRSDLTIIMY